MPDEKDLAYWSERFGVPPEELKRTWDFYLTINPPGHMVRTQVSEHRPDRPAIWTMPDWAALAIVAGILAAAWAGYGVVVKPHFALGLLIVCGFIAMAGRYVHRMATEPGPALTRTTPVADRDKVDDPDPWAKAVPFTGLSRLPDGSIDRKRYRAWMMSDSEYRRLAAECLEVAQRMSLHRDRAHLMEMAQRWLGLAVEAERQPSGANNPAIERAV